MPDKPTEYECRVKRGDGSLTTYPGTSVNPDAGYSFHINKKTHRLRIPKSGEDEHHVTVVIEPIDFPEEK